MMELIYAAFSPVNLVFTILLLLVVLYWVLMILGALDLDFLHADVDADVDVDVDMDADVDVDGGVDVHGDVDGGLGEGSPPVHAFTAVLQFFYVGKVPMMVLMTILVLSLWMISLAANHILNPWNSALLGLAIAGGNIVVSAMILKAVGSPLARLFHGLYEDPNRPKSAIGRVGKVLSAEITAQRMGHVEVTGTGAPLVLNAVAEGEQVLQRGDEAVVLERSADRGVYIVSQVDLDA